MGSGPTMPSWIIQMVTKTAPGTYECWDKNQLTNMEPKADLGDHVPPRPQFVGRQLYSPNTAVIYGARAVLFDPKVTGHPFSCTCASW